MATDTGLPIGPPTTQAAKPTAAQDAEAARLDVLYEAARANIIAVRTQVRHAEQAKGKSLDDADTIALASPEYKAARDARDQTLVAYNNFVREVSSSLPPPTYYDAANNLITKAQYDAMLAQQRAGTTTDTSEVHITSSDSNTVPSEDPAAGNEDDDDTNALGESNDDDDGELTEEEQAEHNARVAEASQIDANNQNDWRVRLHLAPSADYLYKSTNPGILKPLAETNGIIFPYTPTIAVQYNADYENYDLVHSNYRGYFYKGSQVQNILVTATFTANDVNEANYLLASLHFLRSATKMFYGNDKKRGMPPPVVFLTGLGEFQFNNHPCAVTMMNYNLPNDVDYIPCGKPAGVQPTPPPSGTPSTSEARLPDSVEVGGGPSAKGQSSNSTNNADTIYNKATYVPTKIDINFTMIPIQTRDQISKDFSLEKYANGDLLKKGFW